MVTGKSGGKVVGVGDGWTAEMVKECLYVSVIQNSNRSVWNEGAARTAALSASCCRRRAPRASVSDL